MAVLYQFEDVKTGRGVELFLDVDAAPRNGETMRHEGRTLRRVPTLPQAMIEPSGEHTCYHFSDDDCATYGPKDRHGRPRALDKAGGLRLSSRETTEMESRLAAAGRGDGYDRGQFRNKKRKKQA